MIVLSRLVDSPGTVVRTPTLSGGDVDDRSALDE
jgi:hypothetical protein